MVVGYMTERSSGADDRGTAALHPASLSSILQPVVGSIRVAGAASGTALRGLFISDSILAAGRGAWSALSTKT
jgi:hypothetical protein